MEQKTVVYCFLKRKNKWFGGEAGHVSLEAACCNNQRQPEWKQKSGLLHRDRTLWVIWEDHGVMTSHCTLPPVSPLLATAPHAPVRTSHVPTAAPASWREESQANKACSDQISSSFLKECQLVCVSLQEKDWPPPPCREQTKWPLCWVWAGQNVLHCQRKPDIWLTKATVHVFCTWAS